MKIARYPLTYFTNSTKAELEDIVLDLNSILPRYEIANLFVENFNPDALFQVYGIDVTNKLELAIKKTLQYDIDTEMLIRFIYDVIDRSNET